MTLRKRDKYKVISDKLDKPLFGYKNLIAWQKANLLAELVYEITLSFPKHEVFGLTSQLRRACLSVPLNIVEGYARNNRKEFHRFLGIALGSLAETEYLIEFTFKQKYLSPISYQKLSELKEETGRILWKLYLSQG